MSELTIQPAFAAVSRSVSGFSNHLEIQNLSISFVKPGLMANTLLILALPSVPSLWLFPLSMLSFSPKCWSRSWAFQDCVWPWTPRLLTNAPNASWLTCAIHRMWLLNAGHSIPEAWSVDCSSQVIEMMDKVVSVVIPSKRPLLSSKRSRTSSKCMLNLALVCWPLTFDP